MRRESHDRPLAEDVVDHVNDARLARQWGAVSSGLAARPRRSFLIAALAPAAIVAVALIAVLLFKPWRPDPSSTVARAPDAVVLPDGSRMTLSSGADVVLERATREAIHVLLGAGRADFDVTHIEGRRFVVGAGGHEVTVLGTAFVVTVDARDGKRTLSVEVSRGRVRVSGPTGEHTLDAGQSWSAPVDALAQSGSSASGASASALAAPAESAPVPETLELPASSAEPTARPAPSASAAPVEGPRELLARATEARAAGRPRDAALALDMLRKKHRTDARAGLAAFELGRLRMDALGDPAGAAEAFGDALALSPSAPYREDAEARRVDAYDMLPDRARCERARDAFIARYPAGVHTNRVFQRCKRP